MGKTQPLQPALRRHPCLGEIERIAIDVRDPHHEATSRLFERGYSIQEVAQFTLHESWATLKRYTHLKPEDVKER